MRSCGDGLAEGDPLDDEDGVGVGVGNGFDDPPHAVRADTATTAVAIATRPLHSTVRVPLDRVKGRFDPGQPSATVLLSLNPLCMGARIRYL